MSSSNKQAKAKTHSPSLWHPRVGEFFTLSGLPEGLWGGSRVTEKQDVTHPDQTLKPLPNNSATANYIVLGLHMCREGAGRGQAGK